ncbi:MAG: inorganic phosphate transporter [Candidatus Gastranaerophilales bacterium]|nr:inorganic phosphate transporter [Candidatus Gastranaerophilales bacterium]
MIITLLIIVIIVALAFEYINGFHDAANAIATVVSTKALTPRAAVLFGASLEFTGALLGTHVAETVGAGMVSTETVTQTVILCALLAAITWNLFTWFNGLPSSSSHALIGGLIGATVVHTHGLNFINLKGLAIKVVIPMFIAPILGLSVGFILMVILIRFFYKTPPDKLNKRFKKAQLLSSGMIALSHGLNDAQKTMGIITLSLLSFGMIHSFEVPLWVILICAITMSCGVMSGGWKIIRTMGSKVIKLKPIHGFAAESSAASIIIIASYMGIPLSTTQVISTSIMGVGCTQRLSAVKWGVVGNIVTAWIFTIPICIMLSGIIYSLISMIKY